MQKITLALAAIIAGCAAHSGIAPAGDGKYVVTKQAATGFPGQGNLKADALREAAEHCKAQGAHDFTVVEMVEAQPPFLLGKYPRVDLTFRCT